MSLNETPNRYPGGEALPTTCRAQCQLYITLLPHEHSRYINELSKGSLIFIILKKSNFMNEHFLYWGNTEIVIFNSKIISTWLKR